MTGQTTPELAAAIERWEKMIKERALQPFYEVKRMAAAHRSGMKPADAVMDHQAFDNATFGMLANIIAGAAFDLGGGDGRKAQKIAMGMIGHCGLVAHEFIQRVIDGIDQEQFKVNTFADGKPMPFDFRDHIKRDSGRASEVGQ